MEARISIDLAGRVTLPERLMDELHLAPGEVLDLENGGECIILRPVRADTPLVTEKDVWVVQSGQGLSATAMDEMLNNLREERDSKNLGVGE